MPIDSHRDPILRDALIDLVRTYGSQPVALAAADFTNLDRLVRKLTEGTPMEIPPSNAGFSNSGAGDVPREVVESTGPSMHVDAVTATPGPPANVTDGPFKDELVHAFSAIQLARAQALYQARRVLAGRSGGLQTVAATGPIDAVDLINVAGWIMTGEDPHLDATIEGATPDAATWSSEEHPHRLYPYESGDVTQLAPETFIDSAGVTISHKGRNFYAQVVREPGDDDG